MSIQKIQDDYLICLWPASAVETEVMKHLELRVFSSKVLLLFSPCK